MNNYLIMYILSGIATLMVIFWIFMFVKYKSKFSDMTSALDSKVFIFPELYCIGLGVIDFFKINMKSDSNIKMEKKIAEVYGEKYAQYYLYCIKGGQISYAVTLLPIGIVLGVIADEIIYSGLGIAFAVVLIIYLDYELSNSVEKKRDEIMNEFPEVLSQLTLLINAGMILREAWNTVSATGDSYIYKEMQQTSIDMQNGMSDADALYYFGQRCGVKAIRKFASVLTQNLQKGGSELSNSLKYMNHENWEEKRNDVKRKGEAAGQKLMMPIMIMFIGILFMIMVPIFTNMF